MIALPLSVGLLLGVTVHDPDSLKRFGSCSGSMVRERGGRRSSWFRSWGAVLVSDGASPQIQASFRNVLTTSFSTRPLFQTTVPNLNLHIKNILFAGELTEGGTIRDYLIVRL